MGEKEKGGRGKKRRKERKRNVHALAAHAFVGRGKRL